MRYVMLAALILGTSGCSVGHLVQEEGYKGDIEKMNAQLKAAHQQCEESMEATDLNSIRTKVELDRPMGDGNPPPFSITANDSFPTDQDRPAIAKWAALRDVCIRNANEIRTTPSSANAKERIDFPEQVAIPREATSHVGELLLALYQQKMTYGEFAQEQYEFDRGAAAAELAFTRALLEKDDEQREQDEEQAKQQFATVVKAWTEYVQRVSVRQPRTAGAL